MKSKLPVTAGSAPEATGAWAVRNVRERPQSGEWQYLTRRAKGHG